MIKTNIWVFFVFYTIYALISAPLFLMTSGGWMALFYYLGFTGLYYIFSTILLFLSAAGRTRMRRTKVKINGSFFLRILAIQVFVVLFNYSNCGDSLCYQGFLPTLLEDTSIPIWFAPPYTLVLLALLLYIGLLSLFLLDVAWKAYKLHVSRLQVNRLNVVFSNFQLSNLQLLGTFNSLVKIQLLRLKKIAAMIITAKSAKGTQRLEGSIIWDFLIVGIGLA